MTTVIMASLLLDGTGSEPIENPVLVIEDGRLTAVGTKDQVPVPPDAKRIDLTDKVLLPGLIDAHVHLEGWRDSNSWAQKILVPVALVALRAVGDARKMLYAGFTSARCAGGSASIFLKQAIDEGSIEGPKLKTAGRALCLTGGIPDEWELPIECMQAASELGQGWGELVDGPDEIRKAVRRRRREGADLVKCFSTGAILSKNNPLGSAGYSPAELEALVYEAHRQGMKVACHAIDTQGIRDAVVAGVDTIEHCSLPDDECIELMVEKGTCLVPTFSVSKKVLQNSDGSLPEQAIQRAQTVGAAQQKAFRKAYQAGVKIVCGSDCTATPPLHLFGENAFELLYMVDAGMTPMDAIVAATSTAAQAIGMDDTGLIAVGKCADLIAVDQNPLENMETLLDVSFVMQQGKVVKH